MPMPQESPFSEKVDRSLGPGSVLPVAVRDWSEARLIEATASDTNEIVAVNHYAWRTIYFLSPL